LRATSNFLQIARATSTENDEKATMLIVDDDIDTLTVTGRRLGHAGFKVHAFADPLTALHHIDDDDCKYCQVLVSDIRMLL
jgi:DNA-binding NtrC family response regulator